MHSRCFDDNSVCIGVYVYAYVSTHRHSININSIHMYAKKNEHLFTHTFTLAKAWRDRREREIGR